MAAVKNHYCPPADPIAIGRHPMPVGRSIVRSNGVDAWVLHYTLRGAARFHHACGSLVAQAGDLVLIEPGTPQHYGTEGPAAWDPLWAVFEAQPHWQELLAWPSQGPGHRMLRLADGQARRRVEQKLRDAIKLLTESPGRRGALAMNALEAALLWCAKESASPGETAWDPRLQRAISHIYRNFHRGMSLEEVATAGGISLPHLNRLFRSTLSTSPGQYLEMVRLKRAQELLSYTTMSVQSIAAATGFSNPFYFTNRFRKSVGAGPRDYRKGRLMSHGREDQMKSP